jgi:DNA polymerase III sliding clamp (beta) subunit (PCNA family)
MNKIHLPVAELKPALIGLGKIINKRCTLPVLQHIKIERTKDGWTAMTATDLDAFITVRLEQPSTGDPLSLLVPYDELLKIAKTCQKNDTLLMRGEKTASGMSAFIEYAIGNQVAEARVESLPVEEFPETPRVKGETVAVPDTLRSSIHQALECASIDETRLILNGCFIDLSDAKCNHVVGTDGRHLFSSNSFSLPLKESVLIPSHKFMGWKEFNSDGEWQMKANPKAKEDSAPHFQISSRRWRFIGRQIEGNYPNWKQVVPDPSAFTTSLELDPMMIQTIERMPCDDVVNFAIGLEWNQNRLQLVGRSPNAERPTIVEVQEVKGTGNDISIFLNRHFIVKALEFGLTKAQFIDGMSPMRFVDGGRMMIVMPTRPNVPATAPESAPVAEEPNQEETPTAQPAAANAAPQERTPMITAETPPPATTASKLDEALEVVETLKSSCQDALAGLKDLGAKLKAAQKEQKTAEREVQIVRSTLRSLQSMKL